MSDGDQDRRVEDALRSFLRAEASAEAPRASVARVLAIPDVSVEHRGWHVAGLGRLAAAAATLAVVAVVAIAVVSGRGSLFPGMGERATPGNAVAWTTPYVSLRAEDLRIEAGSKVFTARNAKVNVHSDPGDPTYRTLELSWTEAGVEMCLFLYLAADGTDWWVSSIRTYDGLPNTTGSNWIYYEGPFFRSPLSATYHGDADLGSTRSDNGIDGRLVLTGLSLHAFALGASDAPHPNISAVPCPSAYPSDATCAQVLAGPSGYAPPTVIATMAPGFELHLVNTAGPTVDVLLNGVNVGRLTCTAVGVDLVIRPDAARPPLPWTIEFVTTDGTSLGSAVVDGSQGPTIITVEGQSFSVAPWPISGAPTPLASCPP